MDLVAWSAPVDDLTQWRYEGIIFTSPVNGTGEKADVLFAPDMMLVEKDGVKTYYLYPNTQAGGRGSMVAKSSSPIGPFEVCNWKNGSTTETEGPMGFDPGVIYDEETGKGYGYWGSMGSNWCEFNDDMATTTSEKSHKNLPNQEQSEAAGTDFNQYNIVQDEYVRE